jgi:hypothetical protein
MAGSWQPTAIAGGLAGVAEPQQHSGDISSAATGSASSAAPTSVGREATSAAPNSSGPPNQATRVADGGENHPGSKATVEGPIVYGGEHQE